MGFNSGFKGLNNVSSLDSVRNKDGQSLDMFYVLIFIIATPYSLASRLMWFFLLFVQLQLLIYLPPVSSRFRLHTHAFRPLLRVFYALPKVQHTCSKNAELSSATSSFP